MSVSSDEYVILKNNWGRSFKEHLERVRVKLYALLLQFPSQNVVPD